MKAILGGVAIGAALLAGPAQAAGCWSEASYEAAQMRDFDTMLMVATLRCRIKNIDFGDDYNRFVRSKRPILAQANQQLRTQFALSVGRSKALSAYDDYMTKLANGYGGGTENMSCADYAVLARAAADAPAQRTNIVGLARKAGSAPYTPNLRCGVTVAMNNGQ